MNIGINYIREVDKDYDNLYKILIEKGYINTLKFPGKYCNYEQLEKILELVKSEDCKIDIHGLPKMVAAIHSEKALQNVEFEKLNSILFNENIKNKITRFSTHIGLENRDRLQNYSQNFIESTFKENIKKLKNNLNNIEVGIENVPGGFDFDIKTLTPEFISNTWQKVDFGVFDITHAKLSARVLDLSYEEYLKRIENKENVKILHISGNIDETEKYENKPDKHVLINKSEIKDIINTIKVFPNLDLIISEYAYNTKYTYEKEIVIEAITLHTIVTTMDEEKSINILENLSNNLKDDLSL